jgi:hypothetical protein
MLPNGNKNEDKNWMFGQFFEQIPRDISRLNPHNIKKLLDNIGQPSHLI